MRRFLKWWPWIAAPIFWLGAVSQAFEILAAQSAGQVSSFFWITASALLYGYALFYTYFMDSYDAEARTARLSAICVSIISGSLYAVVAALTIVY